jgi:superfamily II DNA or RNA helicase
MGMKEGKFVLLIVRHRLWGYIFHPYIIVNEPNKKYFQLSEPLFSYLSDETLKSIEEEERELVRIVNDYSDRALFKLFSKDKSVKDFLENVQSEKIERFIRPLIEKRLRKCFLKARDAEVPCFLKRTGSNIVYPDDRIELSDEVARPVFVFNRQASGSTYKLKVELAGKPVDLFHNQIEILCNSPCLILTPKKLLLIDEIDGLKLRPFLTKESVSIPRDSEVKYFSSFVKNAVNFYKVEGTGFNIIKQEPEKKAHLSIEMSIRGYPVIILSFYYSENRISPDDNSEYFTKFLNEEGIFSFLRFHRDFSWELKCIDLLIDIGFFSDDNINFYIRDENACAILNICALMEVVNHNYYNLIESGFTINTRNLAGSYNLKPVTIEIINTIDNDWFDLHAVIRIDKWQFPFTRFRYNILNEIQEYELPDGTIAILPEEWFTKYRNIFEFGNDFGEHIKVHKQHFSFLSDILEDTRSEEIKKLKKLLIPDELKFIPRPAGFRCEMRRYQHEGLNWLHWLQSSGLGGLLADDMGLGKTIQALALLQNNLESMPPAQEQKLSNMMPTLFDIPSKKLTSLVIVPASLVFNWENEIRRFLPGMKVYCHKGGQRATTTSQFVFFDIVISSYHTVRQDIDLLSAFKFHYIILDESQSVKNPGSLIYKSVVRLKSDFRLALSGSPVENSLTDLWAQLNFVNPGMLGSLSYFRNEYVIPIEKQNNSEKEAFLKKLTKPFILRRTKETVAGDLPAVAEQTIFCDMTEEQSVIYEKEKSSIRNIIMESVGKEGLQKAVFAVLQGLMRLRQISNHPVMADEEYPGGSGKFDIILNDIENVVKEGHKILVFSSFVMHLKLVSAALEKNRIGFSMLTGASTDREKIVNRFQNEDSIRVFLISLKAGGVGLNLTAADYVFIIDPWWNPASEIQALSRAHRIGQNKNVFVYRYISTGTLEEKIIKLQERKSKLAESFIHSNNPLQDAGLDQILELIG